MINAKGKEGGAALDRDSPIPSNLHFRITGKTDFLSPTFRTVPQRKYTISPASPPIWAAAFCRNFPTSPSSPPQRGWIESAYIRVAGYLVCLCQTDQQLNLAWPRIQKGFEATEKRYGASPENWNLMAHMAVGFGECEAADKLFIRIGDQWSEDVWLDSSAFESAKQWAKQIEPVIAKKRPAEEAAEANLQTAEGQTYNAVFAGKIHTWMQPCIEELAGKDLGKFELLIKVGQAGTIDEITGGGL
jgi:hypothetical protein